MVRTTGPAKGSPSRGTGTMIVGLTGGIASGKSTVASILRELGASVIDADIVARDVVAPGSEALAEIEAAFGSNATLPDGSLNREAVGAMVMSDPTLRARLESITHPRIRASIATQVEDAVANGAESVFVEAALLVETGSYSIYPDLWVVSCDDERQVERLMARKGCDSPTARQWIAAQMPLTQKVEKATTVIDNNGTIDELRGAVAVAYAALMARQPDRD